MLLHLMSFDLKLSVLIVSVIMLSDIVLINIVQGDMKLIVIMTDCCRALCHSC